VATVGEVITRLRAALTSCGTARAHLRDADRAFQAAKETLTQALAGAGDDGSIRLRELTLAAVDDAAAAVQAGAQGIEHYVRRLGSDAAGDTTGSTAPTPAKSTDPPSPERIEQLRDELPPPVVPGTGQKTLGRWIAPDGTAQPLTSGRDVLSNKVNDELKAQGCPRLPARAGDDVELKLAALMRERGKSDPAMRHVSVVINNRPGEGDLSCDELVPVILPEGYSLTVHAPNYRERFTGGAKPWWR
jgi:hypothetical protein